MPALFIFLFKVNIALVLFCAGYYLVLRHLTFYTLNRIYLVIAILFSTLYPNINLSGFGQRHLQLTGPVQNIILNWKAPAENFVRPLYQPNYWHWTELVFWAGVILFAARLLLQMYSLYQIYRQSRPGQVHDHRVRLVPHEISPFSFWRSIYINPSNLSPVELKSVLEHEQIHVNEWHTLDILLAELSTIFYWFNPGVWLMKKAVRENIEFITDRKILRKGMDSREYQYTLVSIGLAGAPNTLVNHFNISTIKKRIIMMNTKRSSGYSLTRYLILIPVVFALLLAFSLSKAATKKGLHTFKSIKALAADITDISLSSKEKPPVSYLKLHLPVSKHRSEKSMAKKTPAKTADTLYAGKSKDGKKTMLLTSDSGLDSTTYMINGVPAARSDVKALDPGKIISLDLLDAKYAKEFYQGAADLKSKVVFITTNDSQAGKKIKEQIGKSFRSGKLARVYNLSGDSSNYAPPVVVSGFYVSSNSSGESSDQAPVVRSLASSNVSTSVSVTDEPKTSVKLKKMDKVSVTTSPVSTITVIGDGDSTRGVYAYSFKAQPAVKARNLVYVKAMPNNETTLDSSNPLIIIDGKEAKSLKNIAADEISSITVLKELSAIKRYGDKGKNGVIVIKTKKGK